jgi:hydroxymethylbilane synthase
VITFGSRSSDLAMLQTRRVAERLAAATGVSSRIEVIETTGDRVTERPLAAIGIKGAFTVELEAALRQGRIDVAVHSLKDLPVDDPADLVVGAVPERVDPADVLLIAAGAFTEDAAVPLRTGSRIGTSSPRRRLALAVARPDLAFADIRGNVGTRVAKVQRGDYDAAVFAAAGLDRLQLPLDGLRRWPLPFELSPPAPGQGALAVQCRRDDIAMRRLLAVIHDGDAGRSVDAERALLGALGGGCSLPLGALVTASAGGFRLQAMLFGGAPARALRADVRGTDLAAMVRDVATPWQPLLGAPLRGQRIAVLRPDGDGGDLAAALAIAGASVDTPTCTRTEALAVAADSLAAVAAAPALAFTSARAVQFLPSLLQAAGLHLQATAVFAVGAATAAAARTLGIATHAAGGSGGRALAELAADLLAPGGRIGFPCAAGRQPDFETAAAQRGLAVLPLPVYRTVEVADAEPPAHPPDVVLLTSPSAVAAFAARQWRPGSARLCAIGPTTAAAMQRAGLPIAAAAAAAEPKALIAALTHLGEVHHE